jgi:aminobenzoyl-glutamate utilization protein B
MGAIISSWPLNIPPHQWGCTACNGMSLGRKGVVKAAHVLAATGLDLFTDAELRSAARAEFDERTAGKPYLSLCEKDGPIGGYRPEHHEGHDQALEGIAGMVRNTGNSK